MNRSVIRLFSPLQRNSNQNTGWSECREYGTLRPRMSSSRHFDFRESSTPAFPTQTARSYNMPEPKAFYEETNLLNTWLLTMKKTKSLTSFKKAKHLHSHSLNHDTCFWASGLLHLASAHPSMPCASIQRWLF